MYLVISDGAVLEYHSVEKMQLDGFETPDMEVARDEWEAAGCYARIEDGKIILGKSDGQIQADKNKTELDAIDRELTELNLKQSRSSGEIAASMALNKPVPERALEEHLKREARLAELRAEREKLDTQEQTA
jgi:hypothetical protein